MTNSDKPIGIVGIGLLGTAIAERLLGAGYRLIGYDLRPEQIAKLQELGGESACCAASVADRCERLILSLPTSAIAASVLDEIVARLRSGSIVIDTTTGAPEDAANFADRLQQLGVQYLDATVGGSSRQVRTQEAIFICGGCATTFDACADIFAQCCRKAYHMGPAGSGARMKLVLNLVLGLHRAVLAEGLEFARACNIDPCLALEILQAGPAYSRAMDTKGHRMLKEDFEPEARLSQHLKDVRLILAAGETTRAKLPLSTIHRDLLEAAEEAGFGAADNSAIIKSFQKGSR
jgi:3-hydroxyisobutyrate dehydrogenase-like beta-hydroxyacid dehydrogenase